MGGEPLPPVARLTMLLRVVATLFALLALMQAVQAASVKEWNFAVTLDGNPIGTHRFVVWQDAADTKVTSEASFVITFLGIAVYHYRHEASETWRANCLGRLQADTNDGGDLTHVSATGDTTGGRLRITADQTSKAHWDGCLFSFAYWHPALPQQTRLLNPQTGEIEPVRITPDGEDVVLVRGQPVRARSWRIVGRHDPLRLWLNENGDWVGLDADVKGGRRVSYRLQ